MCEPLDICLKSLLDFSGLITLSAFVNILTRFSMHIECGELESFVTRFTLDCLMGLLVTFKIT